MYLGVGAEESLPGTSGQNESLRQDGVFCHWSQSSQLDIVPHTSISVRSSVTYGNHCCTFSTAHALLWKYESIPPSQCFVTSYTRIWETYFFVLSVWLGHVTCLSQLNVGECITSEQRALWVSPWYPWDIWPSRRRNAHHPWTRTCKKQTQIWPRVQLDPAEPI